jgi:hypothetical protein
VPFVCVVGSAAARAEYDFLEAGNAAVVVAPVGYDDITNNRYSVFCGLEVMAGGGLEYYFVLTEVDADGDEVKQYWSGRDVARFVSEPDRKAILDVVLTATHLLVERVRPDEVFFVTHDPKLPEKALIKYSLIISAFNECGYDAKPTDPYHGKQSWWLIRRDEIDGRTRTSENVVQ